ncbi:ABC transporter permease [Desulfomarina profundi]|uniref:ABC transporter permease n=1 Tax=Desulfomarina profundi TaxID=2772557 RepID=A0A8D5FH23_9BACT|nr:ABC transporter permease [Desulfomarina profundi]BCL61482.1 ABC transporter permease [Desulfomarina profundi]
MDLQIVMEYAPEIMTGVVITIKLVVVTMILGLLLAVPLALCRNSKSRWLSIPVYGYIYFFRGTPLLVQLFIIYYGFSQFESVRESFLWNFLADSYWCSIIAFTLNTAAYTAEILRGAIKSVPQGQIEAALSVGMSPVKLYTRIILPQAALIALPGYSNESVLMMKGTSLASTVALLEVTGITRNLIAETFMPVELFFLAGVIYMILSTIMIWGFKLIELSLSRFRTAG